MPGIMAISRALPVNETQLGAIDHMSKERMKDYKAVILEVTKTYHAAKMDVLATNAQLRKEEEEEEVDFQPSSQLGASAGGGSSRGRGRGRGGKTWKGGFKRKRGGSQGGGGTSKRGRGGRSSRGGGGGGGSMGLPVPAVPSRGYR